MEHAEVQRQMMQDEDYLEYLPPELLVPHYLIHCYLYYKLNSPIIEDHVFDALARELKSHWEVVEHIHKHLIDPEALSSGGSYIAFPLMVEKSAESLWQ